MNRIPETSHRVPSHTDEQVNARIQEQIRRNVTYYAQCSPDQIDVRLNELDDEWDIERALELNAASIASGSILLGLLGRKRWFLVAGIVGVFLTQHALQGWCPPVPVLRRLGFRTAREIDQERYALKALRGDFQGHEPAGETATREEVEAALAASR